MFVLYSTEIQAINYAQIYQMVSTTTHRPSLHGISQQKNVRSVRITDLKIFSNDCSNFEKAGEVGTCEKDM